MEGRLDIFCSDSSSGRVFGGVILWYYLVIGFFGQNVLLKKVGFFLLIFGFQLDF